MSQVIPEGWVKTSLDKLSSDISYGYTAKSTLLEVGPQMLRITDIQNNRVNWSSVPYCEIDVDLKAKYLLDKGDLLFARTGATVGKSFLIREDIPESVYASYLIRVRCLPSAHIDYLSYFFLGPDYWDQITNMSAGIGQPSVNGTKLKGLALPLPPLAEQQVIADKLDELLAQVESTKARLDAIPAILKSFRQSVLAAAVSGKLTEEWRGENKVPLSSWKTVKVGNFVQAIEAGKSLKCIETPPSKNEFGIIKISAVTWGVFDESESKTLPSNDLFIESRRVKIGDLLISRANTMELLGNPVIVHNVTKNLMLSDKVLRLVMEDANKPWVSIFLRSKAGRKEIESRSTGNQMSMRNIGQKALLDIELPRPNQSEQDQIVRRVEALFAFADKVEAQVNEAQTRVNNLTQSILAKAFRGELTNEWRAANPELISGENSAAALLERIKAERDALCIKQQQAKKPVKKTTAKKAKT